MSGTIAREECPGGAQRRHVVVSPVSGAVIDEMTLADRADLERALGRLAASAGPLPRDIVFSFLDRLRQGLLREREDLVERTILETGFIRRDAEDILAGAIEFLEDFPESVQELSANEQIVRHSYSVDLEREMRILDRPIRCVAGIVPQNASLSLGIIIIASALYAGSRVLLRPSLQCASTGKMLADIIARCGCPAGHIEVMNCLADDMLAASYGSEHVELIHYIGSNRYALPVFSQAFENGKVCLLDGQGNGMLYVDETVDPAEAARLITSGATRFNGETCTSVNGVLIKQVAYGPLREALLREFQQLRVGDPLDPATDIGPLFSARNAADLRDIIREAPDARLLCGGEVRGAYLEPAVIEGVGLGDRVVREGFFGPAIWIRAIEEDELDGWLRSNRFPLSDTVLSQRREIVARVAGVSRAARICVNQDPSVESMFEPWGGYPPSGLNPVSIWVEKYRQRFQLDGRPGEISGYILDNRRAEHRDAA